VTYRFSLLLAAALWTSPALANPTDSSETSAFYGSARNWMIEALSIGGIFTGCRATIPLQAAGPLLLERSYAGYGDWAMFLPTSQAPSPVYGHQLPALFSVDQQEVRTEVRLYPGGWASMPVDEAMLQQLMDGNILTAELQGEDPRQWILNGSTAALDLAQECYERQGTAWR